MEHPCTVLVETPAEGIHLCGKPAITSQAFGKQIVWLCEECRANLHDFITQYNQVIGLADSTIWVN